MEKKTRSELLQKAKNVNLWVDHYNPGGDRTKYKFFKGPNKHDYFEGGELYTANSLREAWAWLEGYECHLIECLPK